MDTYLFSMHKRWNDLIFIELIKKAKARLKELEGQK